MAVKVNIWHSKHILVKITLDMFYMYASCNFSSIFYRYLDSVKRLRLAMTSDVQNSLSGLLRQQQNVAKF